MDLKKKAYGAQPAFFQECCALLNRKKLSRMRIARQKKIAKATKRYGKKCCALLSNNKDQREGHSSARVVAGGRNQDGRSKETKEKKKFDAESQEQPKFPKVLRQNRAPIGKPYISLKTVTLKFKRRLLRIVVSWTRKKVNVALSKPIGLI